MNVNCRVPSNTGYQTCTHAPSPSRLTHTPIPQTRGHHHPTSGTKYPLFLRLNHCGFAIVPPPLIPVRTALLPPSKTPNKRYAGISPHHQPTHAFTDVFPLPRVFNQPLPVCCTFTPISIPMPPVTCQVENLYILSRNKATAVTMSSQKTIMLPPSCAETVLGNTHKWLACVGGRPRGGEVVVLALKDAWQENIIVSHQGDPVWTGYRNGQKMH